MLMLVMDTRANKALHLTPVNVAKVRVIFRAERVESAVQGRGVQVSLSVVRLVTQGNRVTFGMLLAWKYMIRKRYQGH